MPEKFARRGRRAKRCARVPLRAAAGWPDQPAEWTRPRWRRGDWRRVTETRSGAHACARARAHTHIERVGMRRDARSTTELTSRRREVVPAGAAERRPGATPRCNGDVHPGCRVHAPRLWRSVRARASFIYITRPLSTRAQHAFSRDEHRWRRLDAKKYINRVNICRVNSSRVSGNDLYRRDKHDVERGEGEYDL